MANLRRAAAYLDRQPPPYNDVQRDGYNMRIQFKYHQEPANNSICGRIGHHPWRFVAIMFISVILLTVSIVCIVVFGKNQNSSETTEAQTASTATPVTGIGKILMFIRKSLFLSAIPYINEQFKE